MFWPVPAVIISLGGMAYRNEIRGGLKLTKERAVWLFQVGSIDSSWKCPGTQSIDERVAAPEIEAEGGAASWNRCASLKNQRENCRQKPHLGRFTFCGSFRT